MYICTYVCIHRYMCISYINLFSLPHLLLRHPQRLLGPIDESQRRILRLEHPAALDVKRAPHVAVEVLNLRQVELQQARSTGTVTGSEGVAATAKGSEGVPDGDNSTSWGTTQRSSHTRPALLMISPS